MNHVEKQIIYPKSVVKAYNIWFAFLMKLGFNLVPNVSNVVESEYVKVMSFSFKQGQGYEKVETLDDVLSFMNSLKSSLIALDSTTQVTWNYIGSEKSRQQYIGELETFFWNNQDDISQTLPLFSQELIENPWKIAHFGGELELSTPVASSFFDEKGGEFMSNLLGRFANFELDPYLVLSKQGSFHWKIVSKSIEFSGFMEKKEHYFLHTIFYHSPQL
jgi:hypothetical protein